MQVIKNCTKLSISDVHTDWLKMLPKENQKGLPKTEIPTPCEAVICTTISIYTMGVIVMGDIVRGVIAMGILLWGY